MAPFSHVYKWKYFVKTKRYFLHIESFFSLCLEIERLLLVLKVNGRMCSCITEGAISLIPKRRTVDFWNGQNKLSRRAKGIVRA